MSIALLPYLTKYFTPIVVILINAVVCISILIAACIHIRKLLSFKSPATVLPVIQIPLHRILFGFARELPSYSMMKKLSLPPTAYFQQSCSGMAVLFPDKYALIMRLGFHTCILLLKAEAVQEFLCSSILATKAFPEFCRPFFGDGVFLSAGDRWKVRRKLLIPMFHNDIIKDIVPVFDKEAKLLVDFLRRKHHEPWINVVDPVSRCTMDILCKSFLGLNLGAQKECELEFLHAIERVTQTVIRRVMKPLYWSDFIFRMSTVGQQFKRDINFLRAVAIRAIRKRKEERKLHIDGPAEDEKIKPIAMDILLDFETSLGIGEEEVRDELLSFIFAGADTPAVALSWALYLIGLHPEIQTKIYEEIDRIYDGEPDKKVTVDDVKQMVYLECVLKEVQRIYPAGPLIPREALEDFTFADYKVKKGDIIVVDTYSLHRDPDVFPNPEVFDPERFLPEKSAGRNSYAYVPFSGGVRNCPGSRFAMMEMKTVLANILYKFSLKSVEPRDKINTSYEIVLRPSQPLNVNFTPIHIADGK